MFTISKWLDAFEHPEPKRRPKSAMNWHKTPVELHSGGRLALAHLGTKGHTAYFFFMSIVAWSSGRPSAQRGLLAHSNGSPLEPQAMAMITSMTVDQVEESLQILASNGWLVESCAKKRKSAEPLRKSSTYRIGEDRIGEDRIKETKQRQRWAAPSVSDVEEFTKEKSIQLDAQAFVDHYTSNGWKVGKNPMKDWKAAARNWARRNSGSGHPFTHSKPSGPSSDQYPSAREEL